MTNAGVQQEQQECAMSEDYALGLRHYWFTNCLPVRENSFGDIPGPCGTYDKCSLFDRSFDMSVYTAQCAYTHVKLFAHFRVFATLCKALKVTPFVEPSANHVASREVDLSLSSGSDYCKKKLFCYIVCSDLIAIHVF
jgi:hypothetical protein